LCRQLDIRRVKLTGGEPLVRSGVVGLVQDLAGLPEVEELSATTNGSLLAELARPLRTAGLARVNISVDSLDPERFEYLTRGGRLADTVAGIEAAIAAGLVPVKLNVVLLASSWRSDVPALLDFAQGRDLEVRFIELMRTGTERWWASREYVAAIEVCKALGLGTHAPLPRSATGPARTTDVEWRGARVRVGWITPRSERFCSDCRRLRLDARGNLRRCLMDSHTINLADLRAAAPEREVRRTLDRYLAGKEPSVDMDSELPMITVGG
jgi:cyclic pyranopterin phosphate synthase